MGCPPEEPDGGDDVRREVANCIREIEPPPKNVIELEYLFEALAHPRRRYLLYSLLSSTRWTLQELATKLVAWEQDISEDAVADFDRDEMFVSLHHAHVPKLVEHDIIEYQNGEQGIITADRNAVQVLAALEGIGASVDTAQETHARRDYQER